MTLNKLSPSPLSLTTPLVLSLSFLTLQLFLFADGFIIYSDSKILGGAVAADKSFPFQVYLEFPNPINPKLVDVCSGSIINHSDGRYKILTGAHCSDSIREHNKPTDKDLLILVVMGANNVVTQRNRGKTLKIKFGLVKIHPDYDEETNADDLAIIPLPDDFKPVAGLYEPIGLAPPSDVNRNYAGTTVQIAGWGVTSSLGEDSDQLLFIQSKILADDPCEEARVLSGSPGLYNNNFLCIDGTGNKGTCHGDSGGPLIEGTPSVPVIVGISSYRLTHTCEGSTPTFFIRVVKYLQWIQATI